MYPKAEAEIQEMVDAMVLVRLPDSSNLTANE
jgi:hypothetical protein